MNKLRLEFLSDGVFAIVMTLLIIEIHVPEFDHLNVTNGELWQALLHLSPLFVSYFVSFLVLSMFWLSHNALYSFFAKNIDRYLILLNMLYLCTIAFIPFSAHLIGRYPQNEVAFIVYGLNLFVTGSCSYFLLKYAILSKEIDTDHVSSRVFKQAAIRVTLTPFFSLLGILAASLGYLPVALFFFGFPIVFNILPGGLDFLERKFKFRIG